MHLRERDGTGRMKNGSRVKEGGFEEDKFFVGVTSRERVPDSRGSQKGLRKENPGNSAVGGDGFGHAGRSLGCKFSGNC